MYKILIIFLFAFLIADESIMYFTTQGWERSDRLKLVESDIEKMLNPFIDEMNNLLNPNMFLINIGFKIIDTKTPGIPGRYRGNCDPRGHGNAYPPVYVRPSSIL